MKKCLFVLLLLVSPFSYADCLQASSGQVFCGAGSCKLNDSGIVSCSMYRFGGAESNLQGRVKCGRGQCLQNSTGSVVCSVEEDGGAAINTGGQVKCYGGCEPGDESMCESVRGS
jgi:hypothetical protein